MTTGSALRPAAMLLFSLAACSSDPIESGSRPPACNLDEQQTQLADVVTTLAFNPRVLGEIGVDVRMTGAIAAAPRHALAIQPGPASSYEGVSECLAVDISEGHLRDFVTGRIAHIGGPTLAHGDRTVSLDGFELRVGAAPRTFDLVTAAGERVLTGTLPHYEIDGRSAMLDVFNVDLSITPALAARWGARQLAGTVVGALSLRARVVGAIGGARKLGLAGQTPLNACDDFSGNVDVALISMDSIQQQGRLGDQVVITPSAVLKNVGTANVPWQARFSGNFPPYNTDQHPFLVWSLFREVGGVFEPLAYSDVKHAFLTINSNCSPGACTDRAVLGLGCEDVYGVGTNGTHLAPRSEILPHAGTWAHCDFPSPNTPSHFDQTAPFCQQDNTGGTEGVLEHRLVASDAELSVAGANYYFASWYVVRDDINIFNSMGWRKIVPSRTASTWSFALSGAFRQGSVLDAFVDPASTDPNRLNATYKDAAGSIQLAAAVTDLGAGKWRYVYTLANHDFDPKLSAMTFTVGQSVGIEQASFRDGDNDATNNWFFNGGIGQLSWVAPKASARLAWGTAVTITFVANGGPIRNTVRLTRSDNGSAVFVKTLVPDRISI
ncbi:MAG: hypothetical protein WKG01_37810 [Kofleriaceae bacterium]